MTRTLQWLVLRFGWLAAAYRPNPTALGVARIAFALWLIAFPVQLAWTLDLPDDFFEPGPGLPALIGIRPSETYLTVLSVLHYLTAVWLLLGWRTRTASIAVVLLGLFEYSTAYSFGKVDHSILFQLLPLVLALSGWGSTLSLDSRGRGRSDSTSGLPLVVWSVVLAFAFATAAAAKAAAGWWSPNHYGSRSYAVDDLLFGSTTGALVTQSVDRVPDLLWKLIDLGTLFAEGWLLLAIFSPVLVRVALVVLVCFHISVYLVLGIDFSSYLFVYIPFFLVPPREWLLPTARWREWKRAMKESLAAAE